MLIWTIKTAIISFLFIFLVHHLILFLKTTLTVPKIKDLVNSPHHKYQDIYDTLTKAQHNTSSYTAIDLLPSGDLLLPPNINEINENANINANTNDNVNTMTMKNELKNFLKGQLHINDTSEIAPL